MRSGSGADDRAVVLFFRRFKPMGDLTMISGGHLKVWHYFQHVEQSSSFRPVMRTPDLPLTADNPWSQRPDEVVGRFRRVDPQVYFIAGTDWGQLPRRRRVRPDRPVINLIQGVRHGNDHDPRRAFLRFPAVRICVGPEVADAIRATGEVRGPIITIPNGNDVTVDLSRPLSERDIDVVVVGNKRPELTRQIATCLERPGRRVRVLDTFVLRHEFLAELARARLAVFVPRIVEGFYLPALEAMALGTVVVCPDAVGNRSFCIAGETCWLPAYDVDAIIGQAEEALGADAGALEAIRQRAGAVAARHDLATERRAFLDVLADLPDLWAQATGSPLPA